MAAKSRMATFYLQDIFFGVPVECVQEVLEHQQVTPVPLAPPSLPGIINLRGEILTAVDLNQRLQLGSNSASPFPMNVVLRTADGLVSLLVDRIGDVLEINSDLCEAPPETLLPAVREVTSRVCKLEAQLLLVLMTDKLVQLEHPKTLESHPAALSPAPPSARVH